MPSATIKNSLWRTCAAFALVSLFASVGLSQTQHLLYPTLAGSDLLRQLEDDFTPQGPLDYGIARDTLFRRVWLTDQDSLVGQYSGFAIKLDVRRDPTEDAFAKGINTEHLYPQSKGAENGDGRADMHHLYPAREDVNSDRGSLPFGEIPDQQTRKWYRRARQQTSPPATGIRDEFSESIGQRFEPRELRKGDIARAIFYFWTIHRAAAQAADPNFFAIMAPDLCAWHAADPVDADEAERSRRIASYQGNENPFILDCTLADRLNYCPNRPSACDRSVAVVELSPKPGLRSWPNPVQSFLTIEGIPAETEVVIYDAFGRVVQRWQTHTPQTTWLPASTLPDGLYILRVGEHAIQLLLQR